MDIALSTYLFVNHRLNTVWLEKIWQAGFPQAEIFCARQHLDYRNKSQVRELGHWFRDSEMKLHSLHGPIYNDDCWGRTGPQALLTLTEPVKSKRIAIVDEIKRALEVAEEIPFRYFIQHLGNTQEQFGDEKLDAAFTALEELSIFAKQRGVQILLENTPNDLASAKRLNYFLEITHLNLGYCFDTGHAHMNEGIAAAFELMRPRIHSTHIHDNEGSEDQHLFPLLQSKGTIDWKQTMPLLAGSEAKWPIVLELKDTEEFPTPLAAAKESLARLEELV